MLVTVFTPCYNRADLLIRLYDSLERQTNTNFEWVIVNDGSSDDTVSVVETLKANSKIPIIFLTKKNEGKHLAINSGVEIANGDLFFIVDSDDYLTEDAIEHIQLYSKKIMFDETLCGISFRRGISKTEFIGTQQSFNEFRATYLDFRFRFNYKGDMAEVYKTKILRKYPFPRFKGEKFCPESLVWQRIALDFEMLWTSRIIYIGEYQVGGLTDRIFEVRKNAPNATTICYAELAKSPIPFFFKIRAAINYWRFAKYLKKVSLYKKWKEIPTFLSLFGWPLSIIFILKDK